jgi:hypothetical protein
VVPSPTKGWNPFSISATATPSAGSTFSINLVWLAGCTKMLPFLIGNFETRADDSQIDFDYASNTLNEEKSKMGTPTDTTS